MNIDKIKNFFKDDTFAVLLGISIDEVNEKGAICSMTLNNNHYNAGGGVQGGVIYTLADFAFAVASNSRGKLTVTLDSNISYLKVAKGDRLVAQAKLVSATKHTCHYAIEVKDINDNLVAVVNINGYIKDIDLDFE